MLEEVFSSIILTALPMLEKKCILLCPSHFPFPVEMDLRSSLAFSVVQEEICEVVFKWLAGETSAVRQSTNCILR